MKIANGKDFWAGIMFLAFGLGFMLIAIRSYPMGSALRMGPAYFPTMLGALMAILGLIVLIRSFVSKLKHPLAIFPFRPRLMLICALLCVPLFYWTSWFPDAPGWLRWVASAFAICLFLSSWGPPSLFVVLTAVAAFGYLLRPLGLAIAAFILVVGSAYGGHEFKLKENLILGVGLSIFVVFVFIYGLGLSFNVWPYL